MSIDKSGRDRGKRQSPTRGSLCWGLHSGISHMRLYYPENSMAVALTDHLALVMTTQDLVLSVNESINSGHVLPGPRTVQQQDINYNYQWSKERGDITFTCG
ncbi:hypothetical protein JTB14_013714 [Gonioctena quinquepunctata]|nr:hypothetical protein JTB14_013714 [Gonioctena quinquepunctata]